MRVKRPLSCFVVFCSALMTIWLPAVVQAQTQNLEEVKFIGPAAIKGVYSSETSGACKGKGSGLCERVQVQNRSKSDQRVKFYVSQPENMYAVEIAPPKPDKTAPPKSEEKSYVVDVAQNEVKDIVLFIPAKTEDGKNEKEEPVKKEVSLSGSLIVVAVDKTGTQLPNIVSNAIPFTAVPDVKAPWEDAENFILPAKIAAGFGLLALGILWILGVKPNQRIDAVEWKASEAWVSNFTVTTTLVTTVLGLSVLEGNDKPGYALAAAFFALFIGLAPVIYGAFVRKGEMKEVVTESLVYRKDFRGNLFPAGAGLYTKSKVSSQTSWALAFVFASTLVMYGGFGALLMGRHALVAVFESIKYTPSIAKYSPDVLLISLIVLGGFFALFGILSATDRDTSLDTTRKANRKGWLTPTAEFFEKQLRPLWRSFQRGSFI
jgi:hypothetical protein